MFHIWSMLEQIVHALYLYLSSIVLCYNVIELATRMVEPLVTLFLLECLEDTAVPPSIASNAYPDDTTENTSSEYDDSPSLSFHDASYQAEREQALRDYKVTIEYKHLKSHAPGGVYLIPSHDTLRLFYGVIFVRRGPYTNGIFKFTLELPTLYNDVNQHPVITFTSHVYNPYVDSDTGRLDLQTTYPRWDPSRHYLVTVLTFLKKIFYAKTFEEAAANLESKTLAATNPVAWRTKVDVCVKESQDAVYDSATDGPASSSTLKFTEEMMGHRVIRDLLKKTVKDPSQVSKETILGMIDTASKVPASL